MDPIAMNFATGNMLGKDFLEHFPGTLETYRYLGFHEYDWPTMWRLHEENIRTKDEDGMWLTLRYRRAMQDVRRVYGDRHTVLITECGMTQGVQGGDDVGPWHESHPDIGTELLGFAHVVQRRTHAGRLRTGRVPVRGGGRHAVA